jgi:hypothetical protein
MSELTIRSNNIEALQRIADLVKIFGLEIVNFTQNGNSNGATADMPIFYAEEPNVLADSRLATQSKRRLEIEAMAKDPLFKADVAEIMEDFKFVDAEYL